MKFNIESSSKLIKDAQKKFILFSVIGIVLIVITSFFSLSFHHQIIKEQSKIQEFYSQISDQFSLITKISNLSEKFDDIDKDIDENLKDQFSDLVDELSLKNNDFNEWVQENNIVFSTNLDGIITEKKTKKKMLHYISKARELVDDEIDTYDETQENIKFLSQSSREGIGEILTLISKNLSLRQSSSLSRLNKIGLLLVFFCLLQVMLVWLLIFKPLYSTILLQHDKITDALLNVRSASRSKTDFLANVSHEIRTPMTSILGYADILKREEVSPQEKSNAVRIINENASHLLSLIDEILDISKIEAGKFDFQKEKVHLSTFLDEVFSLINVKSKDKKIELSFKCRGLVPEYIYTDPKRLKQILFNVLGNAIKFTSIGYVELTVSYNEEKKSLFVHIKDTGIGISVSQMKKLFKPFEQGDSSVSREHEGTGLGLVLSRRLARGMKGDVQILHSKVGIGTTFEISLDVSETKDINLVSSFSSSIKPKAKEEVFTENMSLYNKKILVVDDAIENARLFKMYLSEAGAEVAVANDGQVALDLVQDSSFDLVLLDLQMPGKDGFHVIKELRNLDFKIPIVALTAHALEEEKIKTKEAGFDDHITKPVNPDFLIKSVSDLLNLETQA